MIDPGSTPIQVSTVVPLPVHVVWSLFTLPHHVMHWNHAGSDWFTPFAESDLRTGGHFKYRMEAHDGSAGFDFGGSFSNVQPLLLIEYVLDDNRKVSISFENQGGTTRIIEVFEPENQNPPEFQQQGWQAILNNFKLYAEHQISKVTLIYNCIIAAPSQKVHEVMLRDETYRKWTSAFDTTSHFKGNWAKGSRMLFLGTGEDGSLGGMLSHIRENIPGKVVSIEHQGMIVNNQEVTTGPEVDEWKGSLENYFFSEANGVTTVEVYLDGNKQFESYFNQTWPEALQILKNLCESNSH
jgi:uncharacterized protein YndB with AHSA1/START domain